MPGRTRVLAADDAGPRARRWAPSRPPSRASDEVAARPVGKRPELIAAGSPDRGRGVRRRRAADRRRLGRTARRDRRADGDRRPPGAPHGGRRHRDHAGSGPRVPRRRGRARCSSAPTTTRPRASTAASASRTSAPPASSGSTMSELRRLGPDDWEAFREIRLRSLADSPDAFGSTLEREQAFTEDDWRRRLSGPVYAVTTRAGGRRRALRQRRGRPGLGDVDRSRPPRPRPRPPDPRRGDAAHAAASSST